MDWAKAGKSSHVRPSSERPVVSRVGAELGAAAPECVAGWGKDLQLTKLRSRGRLRGPRRSHRRRRVILQETFWPWRFWNDPDIAVDTLPQSVELDTSRAGHSVA